MERIFTMAQTLTASGCSKQNLECEDSKFGSISKNDGSNDDNSKRKAENEDTDSIEVDAITIHTPTENKPFTISDRCLRRQASTNSDTRCQFEARHKENEMQKYKIIILS